MSAQGGEGAAGATPSTPTSGVPISSMTGQGIGHADVQDGGHVTAEIRAVNHRHLDVRVRAPSELADHVSAAEDVVRRRLVRGRIEVSLTSTGESLGAVLDVERARAAMAQLRALRDEIAPGEAMPMSLLAAVPGLFAGTGDASATERSRAAVVAAMEAACADVASMRRREGESLAADIEARLAAILALVERIAERGPRVTELARHRLRERIARVLSPGVPLDGVRLEHEVVIAADRSDVAEECTRLRSHVKETRRALAEPADARGKRLDFLCQELAREANTLGQKSADAEIAGRVVDLKVEIERIREQSQNVL